jgi:nitrite reductase/ring-hydroxylating ferredoxin subunit
VLDGLLMAFPTLGLAKIVWATDIILAMDLPEFQPGALGGKANWHEVMATKGFERVDTQRVVCDGRGLFVHRAAGAKDKARGKADEWRVYDSRCPHQATHIPHLAPKDGTLTCPKQQWAFDITSGACIEIGTSPLKRWPSKVVKGRLLAQG